MSNIKKYNDNNSFNPNDARYHSFFEQAKTQISNTRINVARSACKHQINLYWWFGENIVLAQEKYGWGKSIVERLSKDLRQSFNSTFGFSVQNLWYMRQFYLEYKDHPDLQRLVGEIPWGQNLVIFSKIKDPAIREYYLKATIEMGWTRDVLVLQINSNAYQRHVLTKKQNNFEKALPAHLAEQADQTMKAIYMLDTLGLSQPVIEKAIETKMVEKIKHVMLELGYGFAFVGNQYRISHEGREYFIDLLFYNRKLQSLVALELKAKKFLPEYAGKMNFYLNLLDDFVREAHENPSIGIILCSEKDHFEVEYALRGIEKPVGVSEYRLTKVLPNELSGMMPDPKELENEILKELEGFNDSISENND